MVLVGLRDMCWLSSVHCEVSVVYNYFLFPIFLLFHLLFLHLFDHVISRNEDGFKELSVCKCLRASKIGEEVWLSGLLRNEWSSSFHCRQFVLQLLNIWNLEVIQYTLRGFLRMSSVALILYEVIKAIFGLPPGLAIFLLFKLLLVLVYHWESKSQEVLGV
jgi:hypothetical protein